mgnify:CR=1 FL=1
MARPVRELNPFQSTLPRGERPAAFSADPVITSFQSTLPRGERQGGCAMYRNMERISIHAPTRGATLHV